MTKRFLLLAAIFPVHTSFKVVVYNVLTFDADGSLVLISIDKLPVLVSPIGNL